MITFKTVIYGIYCVFYREQRDFDYLKRLGARIKKIRLEKGMKQKDLGYAIDIEKSNMSRIEAGNTNPKIITLKKIAEELEVSLKELLDI